MHQRINLIDFLELYDPLDIFEGVEFPSRVDVETLKEAIIDLCALLEPVYFNYGLFNRKVKTFFRKNNGNYEKMIDVWFVEYDPIANYDKEQIQETERITEDIIDNTTDNSGETMVSAFDSNDYQPESKDSSKRIDKGTTIGEDVTTFKDRTKGNIGVTTTQQMIESEIKLRKELNVYDIIARDFLQTFMVR